MPNPIVHFEIPADDVTRAKAFYENAFGWKITAFPMPPGQEYFGVAAKEKDGTGIDGGLMARRDPGQPFTNYLSVVSIDVMLDKIQANGGTVALPKQEIPGGMGWIAAFLDSERNLLGLHQMAPPAKPKAAAKARPKAKAKKAPVTAKKASKKVAKKAGKRRR